MLVLTAKSERNFHCCIGWLKVCSLWERFNVNVRPGWSDEITIEVREVPAKVEGPFYDEVHWCYPTHCRMELSFLFQFRKPKNQDIRRWTNGECRIRKSLLCVLKTEGNWQKCALLFSLGNPKLFMNTW